MKKRIVWIASSLLIVGLLTGACASMKAPENVAMEMPASEPAYDYAYEESAMAEDQEGSSMRGFDSGTGASASEIERMVIYNANLEIAVEDPVATMDTVVQLAEDSGGFVVYSNVYRSSSSSGRMVPRANVTIRVPAGQLDSIMTEIKELTPNPREDVLSENVSGQDVTAEYTDLGSRLRNLEAAEAALVDLMEEAQEPEDVLNIFNELTYYRGEIEVAKGRMKYLEESAALSAITVEIIAKESLQPIEIAGWAPQGTAKRAVEALIDTGQFLADAGIWFGIYCLPFLIPLGVGVYFLVKVLRKRKAKRKSKQTEVIEKPEA